MTSSGRVDISLNGAESFSAAARRMRGAPAEMRKELYSALARTARPLKDAAKSSAASSLPSSGGQAGRRRRRMVPVGTFTNAASGRTHVRKERKEVGGIVGGSNGESVAARVVGAKYAVRVTGGRRPRATITATESSGKSINLSALDRGRLRHPLYGNKNFWYTQRVPEEWFTRPMEESADKFNSELSKAAETVIKKAFG
jgi:hypothetical protein